MQDDFIGIRRQLAALESRLAWQTFWNVLLVLLLLVAPFYHALVEPHAARWVSGAGLERLKYMAGPNYEYFYLLIGIALIVIALALIFVVQDGRKQRRR